MHLMLGMASASDGSILQTGHWNELKKNVQTKVHVHRVLVQ